MRKSVCIIALCVIAIVGYNDLFLRTHSTNNKLLESINPLPYVAYMTTEKNQPNAIFQTPIFSQYNQYCLTTHRLCQFIPQQQLAADILRIKGIQYVGTNVQENQLGTKGIATVLDTVTNLSPFRTYPYVFAELIVPLQKTFALTGEDGQIALQKQSRSDAIALGKKGERFLCNPQKIANITGLSEQAFITLNGQSKAESPNYGKTNNYANPCTDYELPHHLAFNYFYYLGDAENAAQQYKISAFHYDAPPLTATMVALMYGRGGEHIKSAALRYERYTSLINDQMSTGSNAQTGIDEILGKAVFEIELQLISEASQQDPACGTSYTCLQKSGAIQTSIENSRKNICQSGEKTQNIRCILLTQGLKQQRITLDGTLLYPLGNDYEFARSQDYNTWRAEPSSTQSSQQ